ncbi:MAG: MerR family transcriptional regulator [candidate division NC10 bacterium]|nr:MerR family transcriptional regulator [candidate division NC10 bacterium]HZX60201.1 MerR family transcriptional regulator [Candidatus Methylomirabilis sp.]
MGDQTRRHVSTSRRDARRGTSGESPKREPIPDKLYFRIGEVARLTRIQPYILRYWESEFPVLQPKKSGTGQRLYRKRDIENILKIKTLLYDQGYTIAGARRQLQDEVEPGDFLHRVRQIREGLEALGLLLRRS